MSALATVSRALSFLAYFCGRRCQLCAAVVDSPLDFPLCPRCAPLLAARQGGYCPRCGACFADADAPPHVCLSCRLSPPPWTGLAFFGPYAGTLKELVHRHKFGHDPGLGQLLRFLVRQAWAGHALPAPELVLPVPMRPGMVHRRGFNQSVELARLLASSFSLSLLVQGLSKVRETLQQSQLGRAARSGNVAGAFKASVRVAGRHVLLVDDVMTTGATLTACTRACLDAGASRVDVFVLARAL